jgi:hypothetical protein
MYCSVATKHVPVVTKYVTIVTKYVTVASKNVPVVTKYVTKSAQVDLYGFSDWRKHPGANEKQPEYHYFDNVEGNLPTFSLIHLYILETACP